MKLKNKNIVIKGHTGEWMIRENELWAGTREQERAAGGHETDGERARCENTIIERDVLRNTVNI